MNIFKICIKFKNSKLYAFTKFNNQKMGSNWKVIVLRVHIDRIIFLIGRLSTLKEKEEEEEEVLVH